MEKQYNFNEFDLLDIFKNVWGYTAPPFLYSLQNKVEKKLFGNNESSNDYSFGANADRREYNIKGSPFYAANNNGNEVFMPIWLIKPDGSKFLLQNTISSFVNKITMVETPMVNQKGTFKEEISIDDWDINIKGIIVSPDLDYPDQQLYDLNQLKEMGVRLGIENARASLLLDERETVIIKSIKVPEIKGMKNVQAFELDLVSDLYFEIIIE